MYEKEIGGYLSQEVYDGQEYHKDAFGLNSVRNAIAFLACAERYEKLYIPYLLCESVKNKLEKENIRYEFYHINEKYLPILDKCRIKENEAILIVNYYGILGQKQIIELKKKYQNIIVDNTQDFFAQYSSLVIAVYSCRKYFGVTDGAYLKCNNWDMINDIYEKLPKDFSSGRYAYLLKRAEEGATSAYELFKKHEKDFEGMPIAKMSTLTQNVLCSLNYEKIYKRRVDNFVYLHEQLNSDFYAGISNYKIGTYMYPFFSVNASRLRKRLIDAGIFVPILWPDVLKNEELSSVERMFVENIIPLPIDHRYGWDEMRYIVNHIK